MSMPLVSDTDDTPTVSIFARAVVPVLIAAAVTALVLVAVRAEPAVGQDRTQASSPAPTPYSDMHSRIPQPQGEPEEQPPTF
jgi:hypothetical protein